MKKKSALLASNFKSSFLSCEKDAEDIWRKLFIESKPYSNKLIKLLTISQPDCLDPTQAQYDEFIKDYDLAILREQRYITTVPRLKLEEFNKLQSVILLEFEGFAKTENEEFRDSVVSFTIFSPLDIWELDDYKIRPMQIAGYIDGILNKTKLSGIGTLNFTDMTEFVLDENWGGYCIKYVATHGKTDDTGEAAIDNNWPTAKD